MPNDPPASMSDKSMFSPDIHEIGTRLVDILNQTGFLYRFPAFSGVTLACICQHIAPLQRLFAACEVERSRAIQSAAGKSFTAGNVTGPDPLAAGFDHAQAGWGAFLSALADQANRARGETQPAKHADLDEIIACCHAGASADPAAFLRLKDTIESLADDAVAEAKSRFKPMSEVEWQRFRMSIFYWLIELQKQRLPSA